MKCSEKAGHVYRIKRSGDTIVFGVPDQWLILNIYKANVVPGPRRAWLRDRKEGGPILLTYSLW